MYRLTSWGLFSLKELTIWQPCAISFFIFLKFKKIFVFPNFQEL
jgi:hypothetical protein